MNLILFFQSRNGTYITFSGDIGTKHFINEATENALEQDDIISFGFNTASVYDVNDKNAFIYRLVKENIEVIDLDDSDEEAPAPSRPSQRIIEIDNKVIDIESDSDSEYSGDECLQNIDEQSSSPSVELTDELDEENSSVDSLVSDESDEDASFVVTKTILKCATPTETIALDEDSSASEREAEAQPSNDGPEPTQADENKDKESNGTASEEPSTSESAQADKSTAKNDEANTPESEQEKTVVSSTKDETTRLTNLKRRLAETTLRKVTITKAQPLKKRRQTLTESEYSERKQERKRIIEEQKILRKEKLAALGDIAKAKRDAAAEKAESNRIPFVPKVKNTTVTRGDILCTDLLAHDPSTTSPNLP